MPLRFRRFTIQGAQPSARLSEEICLSEGSQGPLRGPLRGFCGVSAGLCGGPRKFPSVPSHRKVIHIVLSQNTLCKRLFIHIRELLAPPNTICMCKRANFNMYRVVVSAYLYIFENSWPNRILYVCLYFRWRCSDPVLVTWGTVGHARGNKYNSNSRRFFDVCEFVLNSNSLTNKFVTYVYSHLLQDK